MRNGHLLATLVLAAGGVACATSTPVGTPPTGTVATSIPGVTVVAPGDTVDPETSTSRTSTSTATSTATTVAETPLAHPITPTGDPAADAALLGAARLVERERGHTFATAVTVQLLADVDFEAVILQDFADDLFVRSLLAQAELLTVLELIPSGTDYVGIVRARMGEGIIGMYVPANGELYVRGTTMTPYVTSTVVHELTHALDDQRFELDSKAIADGDADRSFALSALAEGSAQMVEQAYLDALTVDDMAQLIGEQRDYGRQMHFPAAPISVNELMQDQYSLGLTFVDGLVHRGGLAALDAAFRDPPESTEQVLHPDKFSARDPIVSVAVPPSDGTVQASGTMGEQTLIELLNAELAPATARAAAAGWGGDRYVLFTTATQECVRIDVASDSVADAHELQAAFRSWAIRQHDATVTAPGTQLVRVTACRAMG
ncbi:unannotated protein [freshwater metagenome]|uniref:Unannotated protein n=1 Tax=freshwater metagenome TaxID=449393 RepID=A0A6J7CT96_9ZZZZ|nr:hypothetical protein [Actinomycetota bacterium]